MYDTLTEAELSRLARKLSSAGTAFYDSAMAISGTANLMRESGRIAVLSPEWEGLQALRRPVVAAMDEMHELMVEVDGTARARRTAPEPMKLSGCTCTPVRGSHKPPCAWAAGR